ncbi:MAG: GNAT family N-acetyltransferase [Eubacteriales bacterium]|nr:GNAT family N-acetyltransferase [Eubacteriales bacterium]
MSGVTPPAITLKPVSEEDADFVASIKINKDIWYYEPENDIPSDFAKVRDEVISRIGSEGYMDYVILNEDGIPAGECHLHWFEIDRGSWEIGYCVLPQFRRRGYCAEAVKRLIDIAFCRCHAHKLVAMCNEHNDASRRVMEKCGMFRELVIREELPWRGGWANQLMYSILEHEYYKRSIL